MKTRTEEDFIGRVEVPEDAYYGAFTARAAGTFRLSGQMVDPRLTRAVALIKKAAAAANAELGTLDPALASAIMRASDEVMDGKHDSQFIIDAFQAGAGTPLHMNVNEVVANRANELLGGKKGAYSPVHPNNHVNMAQSSNDVTPTALRLACLLSAKGLLDGMDALGNSFAKLGSEHQRLLKCGRTHLMDAVPITYGQVFSAWAASIAHDREHVLSASGGLLEIGLGGTAVGTGINTHPDFRKKVAAKIREFSGLDVRAAEDTVRTTNDMNCFLALSGSLRCYASTLNRISNDLRLLGSGPNTGISELVLPPVEPGSSIMPGKVNPSVPEAVNMCCWQVCGNDRATELAVQSGQLELNWGTPLIGNSLLQSMELLGNSSDMLRVKCVQGMKVNRKRAAELLDKSFAYATAFNPYLGYSLVSKLVTESNSTGVPLRELILKKGLMEKKDIDAIIASASGPSLTDRGIKNRISR
jgi:aspartate ammonia-lyase